MKLLLLLLLWNVSHWTTTSCCILAPCHKYPRSPGLCPAHNCLRSDIDKAVSCARRFCFLCKYFELLIRIRKKPMMKLLPDNHHHVAWLTVWPWCQQTVAFLAHGRRSNSLAAKGEISLFWGKFRIGYFAPATQQFCAPATSCCRLPFTDYRTPIWV